MSLFGSFMQGINEGLSEFCPNCKTGVRYNAPVVFCPGCGKKLPGRTTCQNCGSFVKNSKFCPSCGNKVKY